MSEILKLNAKTFREKFKSDEDEHPHTTYGAIEIFFDSLRKKSSIKSIVISNHEFLIDKGRKKAMSLNFVTWKWKPKKNGERPGDFMKRCVTANSYKIIVTKFFNLYADYTLALDVGSKDHDSMLFIQKIKDGGRGKPAYSHIHYNPNIGEELGVVTHFVNKMSTHYKLFGYHSLDGNPNAECASLTWTEAFKFMRLSFNPFVDKRIDLWPADNKNRRWVYNYLEDEIPETEKDEMD